MFSNSGTALSKSDQKMLNEHQVMDRGFRRNSCASADIPSMHSANRNIVVYCCSSFTTFGLSSIRLRGPEDQVLEGVYELAEVGVNGDVVREKNAQSQDRMPFRMRVPVKPIAGTAVSYSFLIRGANLPITRAGRCCVNRIVLTLECEGCTHRAKKQIYGLSGCMSCG